MHADISRGRYSRGTSLAMPCADDVDLGNKTAGLQLLAASVAAAVAPAAAATAAVATAAAERTTQAATQGVSIHHPS